MTLLEALDMLIIKVLGCIKACKMRIFDKKIFKRFCDLNEWLDQFYS